MAINVTQMLHKFLKGRMILLLGFQCYLNELGESEFELVILSGYFTNYLH